ncbi:hypothetical protein DAPPUDRAFT_238879 [Daphnia pulex]|uniref:Uncharacterized protein n=1 Tax=Daphnia pulex TaxID=6669 RepID=E9G7N7_DAPPU|nr:hypothetical protein DAPPUDRAFT_238879 [Daphnia pulex]|eukprot:EFX84507.1 hypothetical protein DAPPUDRAFT_238879 [Daphnia pulex]
MVVPRDISEQRLDYVHCDMDGNQMFGYPMDIQEMGCATWEGSVVAAREVTVRTQRAAKGLFPSNSRFYTSILELQSFEVQSSSIVYPINVYIQLVTYRSKVEILHAVDRLCELILPAKGSLCDPDR